jgi:hypothetical protein
MANKKYKLKFQNGGRLLDNLPIDFNINFPQGAINDNDNERIINEILDFLKGKSAQSLTILSISSGDARTEALLMKAIHEHPVLRTKTINLILYDILYDNPHYFNRIFKLYKYDFRPENLTLYYSIAGLEEDLTIGNIDILIGFNIQQTVMGSKTLETTGFKALCERLLVNKKVDQTTPVFIYNNYGQPRGIRRIQEQNLQDFCIQYFSQ